MRDAIHIAELELRASIGVPDQERAAPQRLTVSITLHPARPFTGLDERIEHTVDYAAVCETARRITAQRPRRLLETLAEELATGILRGFPGCAAVDIELRKFVLEDTAYVAVLLSRERPSSPP